MLFPAELLGFSSWKNPKLLQRCCCWLDLKIKQNLKHVIKNWWGVKIITTGFEWTTLTFWRLDWDFITIHLGFSNTWHHCCLKKNSTKYIYAKTFHKNLISKSLNCPFNSKWQVECLTAMSKMHRASEMVWKNTWSSLKQLEMWDLWEIS